ncbi:hypothetical protein ABG067_003697 [Albugo candida]
MKFCHLKRDISCHSQLTTNIASFSLRGKLEWYWSPLLSAEIIHDLSKCQSCLTNIAGMDRLSISSDWTHNPNELSPTVQFHASGSTYSYMRARTDCQSSLTCGFITTPDLADAMVARNTEDDDIKMLCVLTDEQTSFDCGICLKMTSGAHSIQKFQLIYADAKERYLHVLQTKEINIFEPCSVSDEQTSFDCGICLKMTSGAHSIQKFQLIYADAKERYLHVLQTKEINIFEPCSVSGTCSGRYHEFHDLACRELARKLSNDVFKPSNTGVLGKFNPGTAKDPFHVAIKSIYDTPSGKIYYNTAEYRELNKIIQDPLALSRSSSCLWVEHKLVNYETCQRCMETITGSSVKKLSGIDFLIESIQNVYENSKCISSSNTPDLCKKVVSIPDRFCGSFNTASPDQASRISTIRRGWPHKPTLECFTCLTSMLDILIMDLVSVWMVGSPSDSDCIVECKDLKMNGWEMWDISSIRPISANSIKERFGIVEEQSLPHELMLLEGNMLE